MNKQELILEVMEDIRDLEMSLAQDEEYRVKIENWVKRDKARLEILKKRLERLQTEEEEHTITL